ncbi:short chain dehydrogenase [Paenibacillus sophorae]|uniref:Short chain dehydrogenase n=1 Tax=Paenibacillus sophorae TaxID=1333845 RepID=A0A1H8FA22_9BACL|nr:SDR family NAD(P)-dependent oxidoreductase [Paenibacillus sophorae]SEN28602.1 short chain dehydrogenase [Paenibacillus sophorae]
MSEQTLNKIILITGANKGIGFETARRLGSQGSIILVGARNKERGIEAEAKLRSEGVNAHFIELDVTSQPSIDSASKEIAETFGRLDVLINNVGVALGNIEDILIPSERTSRY